jgi:hypothetical protein
MPKCTSSENPQVVTTYQKFLGKNTMNFALPRTGFNISQIFA